MRTTLKNALDVIASKEPIGAPKMVTMVTHTKPKMLVKSRETGKPNPYTMGVIRVVTRTGWLGCNYENAVNAQRKREAEFSDDVQPFQAEGLWKGNGEWVKDLPFIVRHKVKGDLYFVFRPENKNNTTNNKVDHWFDPTTQREIDPAILAEYLSEKGEATKQEVDKEIFWRVFKLEGIISIKCGEIFEIHGLGYDDGPDEDDVPSYARAIAGNI